MILAIYVFSLMVGQEGQPLCKVVDHLAILPAKQPMASSNFYKSAFSLAAAGLDSFGGD